MPTAEKIESLTLLATSELGESDQALTGTVRIGAPEGFGSYVLAPLMARLADRHPGLDIQLVAISGVLSLSKREADIAVTLSAPREGRLISRKLTDYGLSLYAAPAYLDTRPPIRTRARSPAGRRPWNRRVQSRLTAACPFDPSYRLPCPLRAPWASRAAMDSRPVLFQA